MEHKTRTKTLSWLLSLALALSLLPGMRLTAYAADTTITWTNPTLLIEVVNDSYTNSGITVTMTAMVTGGWTGNNISSPEPGTFVFSSTVGNIKGITINADRTDGEYNGWTNNETETALTWSGTPASSVTLSGQLFDIMNISSIEFTIAGADVAVTGVALNKTSTTLTVGGTETLTAAVSPDDATDKTVKWSVGGTNAGAVKLYSDAACNTEVGTEATDKLTVYAKGISAGSATVTAASNADSTKIAACDVTVHAHDFTYTATGATITATCSDTAAHAEPCTATLTINAPTNLIAGGSAEATVTGEIPGVTTPDILYQGRNGTTYDSTTAPTATGDYTASVTLEGQTASVDFTIKDASYTITIPAKLTVANPGWNATAGVTASGEIAEGTKLTVTATSENSWNLKSGDNAVGYYLATAEGGAKTTAWEFTVDELAAENGTTKDMGAVVEEYVNAPAGDYADTVTFTAEIRSLLNTITIDGTELIYADGDTWAKIVERNPEKIRIAGSGNNLIWRAQDNPLYIGGRTPVRPTDTINPSLQYGFEAD